MKAWLRSGQDGKWEGPERAKRTESPGHAIPSPITATLALLAFFGGAEVALAAEPTKNVKNVGAEVAPDGGLLFENLVTVHADLVKILDEAGGYTNLELLGNELDAVAGLRVIQIQG